MRIWHKDLIKLLPNDFLVDQLYDCMKVISQATDYGSLNNFPPHVRKVMQFSFNDFYTYFITTLYECVNRKLGIDFVDFNDSFLVCLHNFSSEPAVIIPHDRVFKGWHTTRYLQQCVLMLEELYDCNVIDFEEWLRITNGVKNMSVLCNETYQTLFT